MSFLYVFTFLVFVAGLPKIRCQQWIQIPDAVLDACLAADSKYKNVCEAATKDNMVISAGEMSTTGCKTCELLVRINKP